MRFIELHRHSDGKPRLINLDEISEIRPGNDGDHAVIEWRITDCAPLPVKETYTQIHNMLAAAKALVQ